VTPFRFTQSAGGAKSSSPWRARWPSPRGNAAIAPAFGRRRRGRRDAPKSVLAPLARATAATPSLPKLRILVVDDDAVNRQAMRLLLEREGHEVVAVENGLEAIERLGPASDRFDAVVPTCRCRGSAAARCTSSCASSAPLSRALRLRHRRPARDETRRFLEECGQPAVMKPYDFNDLISAIGRWREGGLTTSGSNASRTPKCFSTPSRTSSANARRSRSSRRDSPGPARDGGDPRPTLPRRYPL